MKQHEIIKLIQDTRKLLKISMMYDKNNTKRHHELAQLIYILKDDLLNQVIPEVA